MHVSLLLSHCGDVKTETQIKQFSLDHTLNWYWGTQSLPIKSWCSSTRHLSGIYKKGISLISCVDSIFIGEKIYAHETMRWYCINLNILRTHSTFLVNSFSLPPNLFVSPSFLSWLSPLSFESHKLESSVFLSFSTLLFILQILKFTKDLSPPLQPQSSV